MSTKSTTSNDAMRLSLGETLEVYAKMAGDLFQSPLTEAQRFDKVLERTYEQMLKDRKEDGLALADVVKYKDPETEKGIIADLEARLARYDELGVELTTTKERLEKEEKKKTKEYNKTITALDELGVKMDAVEAELKEANEIFATVSETYDIRHAAYMKSKTAYASLKEYGPSILKQMAAKKDAIQARDQAQGDAKDGVTTDPEAVLNALRAQLADVGAEHRATQLQAKEEDEESTSQVEELLAERENRVKANNRVARWSTAAKK